MRKRGRDGVRRGISSDQVCVLTGINDQGDCFLDVACKGRLDSETASKLLTGRIRQGAIISTDRLRSYQRAFLQIDVAVYNRFDPKNRSAGTINLVNALHSRVRSFLANFKGVSTRRLHNYLMWFKWIETAKRLASRKDTETLMLHQIRQGQYKTTAVGIRRHRTRLQKHKFGYKRANTA